MDATTIKETTVNRDNVAITVKINAKMSVAKYLILVMGWFE